MSLTETYNLFAGLLLIARAAFIAPPAWSRWRRNLRLARWGVRTYGLYQGSCLMVFSLEPGKQVSFSTWRHVVAKTNAGDKLPILYLPDQPGQAEIMTDQALWGEPLSNLLLSIALVITAILPFFGLPFVLAVFLSPFEWGIGYVLAKVALYHFYPPSRLASPVEEIDDTPLSGSGRSHSRRRRRLQRQRDWKEQPHSPSVEDEAGATEGTKSSRSRARDQLWNDMLSVSAPPETDIDHIPYASEEEDTDPAANDAAASD